MIIEVRSNLSKTRNAVLEVIFVYLKVQFPSRLKIKVGSGVFVCRKFVNPALQENNRRKKTWRQLLRDDNFVRKPEIFKSSRCLLNTEITMIAK